MASFQNDAKIPTQMDVSFNQDIHTQLGMRRAAQGLSICFFQSKQMTHVLVAFPPSLI